MAYRQLIVRTTSHRSRERLQRAVPELGREHFEWTDRGPRGAYYLIPQESREAALAITGVSEVKRHISLSVCIKFGA
jgi:hypothetical protein